MEYEQIVNFFFKWQNASGMPDEAGYEWHKDGKRVVMLGAR